ncbi:TadE/TadG family type IV pilus assembly protein [Oceaniglobus indicus]|uniref:TadE/TadG family type IV pilus assembly protein n=1 Tax=Oceaniglobus indicus TaxID=2047749 RepID=UPI000C190618|nr:pilus assembly protein TadE [Oceaniglobus indicus]
MTPFLSPLLRRLGLMRRDEDGTATVEFILLVTPVVWMFMSGAEAGLLNMRHAMLERGTDMAVRAVRINPRTPPTHAEIKQMVCDQALLLPDCMNSVMVELRTVARSDWATISADAECVDRADPVKPMTRYVPGKPGELMLVRACFKARPIFPTTGLGLMMPKDASGDYAAISTSAFVNEP